MCVWAIELSLLFVAIIQNGSVFFTVLFLSIAAVFDSINFKASYLSLEMGASGGIMVSNVDLKTYTSQFESHWVHHSYGLAPHKTKSLVNYYFLEIKPRNRQASIVDYDAFKKKELNPTNTPPAKKNKTNSTRFLVISGSTFFCLYSWWKRLVKWSECVYSKEKLAFETNATDVPNKALIYKYGWF